jgi:hypothetical protein
MSDKEKEELIKFLKEMVFKYPNDQELGKQLRKYYYSIKKNENGVQ